MTQRMQQRRDTAANWTSVNPILANGEIGLETDTTPRKFKIGNGVSTWTALSYATQPYSANLDRLDATAEQQRAAIGAAALSHTHQSSQITSLVTYPKFRKLVLLGDSITDMCGGVRLNGTVQNNFMNGYFTAARWFLNQRFPSVINAGVSGDTTTMIAARIAAVTATSPDVVVVFCGINDCLTADVNNVSTVVSTAQTNLTTIYDALTAANAYIVAIPIWPVSKFVGGLNPGTHVRLAISRINSFIHKQTETRANFVVADIGAAFRNCNTNRLHVQRFHWWSIWHNQLRQSRRRDHR